MAVGPLGVWRGAGDESGGPLGRARPCVQVCVCVRVTAAVNKDGRRRVALVRRGKKRRRVDDAGRKERRAEEEEGGREGGRK